MRHSFVGLTLGLTLLLTGCGSDSEGSEDPTPSNPASASPSTATSPPAASTPTATESPADAEPSAEPSSLPEKYIAASNFDPEQILSTYDNVYSDVKVVARNPSGIEYLFTYTRPGDPELLDSKEDELASTLGSTFETLIKPEMEQFGIKDPNVTWTYLNPDGSEVWSRTFGK